MSAPLIHATLALTSWLIVLPIGLYKIYHRGQRQTWFTASFHILNLLTILTAYLETNPESFHTSHRLYGWLATLLPIVFSGTQIAKATRIPQARWYLPKVSLTSLRSFATRRRERQSDLTKHHENVEPLLTPRLEKCNEQKLPSAGGWRDSVTVFLQTFTASCIFFFGHLTLMSGTLDLLALTDERMLVRHWAHIRYGVLLIWFAVFTFIRWAGCITTLPWSWDHYLHKTSRISAETIESGYFACMGCLSMIEKLINDDDVLVTIRHAPVEVASILCGLCGLIVEHTAFANKARVSSFPVSALVCVILGLGMAAHPYEDKLTTAIHAYFPMFLLGFSVPRIITLVVIQVTAKGTTPGTIIRPLTEIIGVFCLLSGGLMVQAATPEFINLIKDANISAAVTAAYAMCAAIGILTFLLFTLSFCQKQTRKMSADSSEEVSRT